MKPSQILSYLYLGGRTDAKSKETLESLNIKYILNCTPPKTVDPETGCPNYFQKDKSYHYLRVPIFDNIGENIGAHLDSAFKFIEEGKHYGNVLVHCHKGVSRSASFVIGYLMRKNEFTFDEALSFVQSIRPIVQPNEAFLKQLSQYKPYGEGIRANDATTESSSASSVRLLEPSGYDIALPPELVDVERESIVSPDVKFDSESVKDFVDEIPSVNCEDGPSSKRAKLI